MAAKTAADKERYEAKAARKLREIALTAERAASAAKKAEVATQRAAEKGAKAAAKSYRDGQRAAIKNARLAFKRKRAAAKEAKVKMANAAKRATEQKKDAVQAKRATLGEKPRRPAGGAWGMYIADHREEIRRSLPADHKITDVTKAASEKYKALTDTERQHYEEK